MIHECFRVIDMSGGLLNLIPWIRHLAPNLSGYSRLVSAHKPLWKFIEVKSPNSAETIFPLFYYYFFQLQEVVAERRDNFTNTDKCKSFIDAYLLELLKKSNGLGIHYSFSGNNRRYEGVLIFIEIRLNNSIFQSR